VEVVRKVSPGHAFSCLPLGWYQTPCSLPFLGETYILNGIQRLRNAYGTLLPKCQFLGIITVYFLFLLYTQVD